MRILWNIMFKLGLLFNKQRILTVLVQKEGQLSHNDAYQLDMDAFQHVQTYNAFCILSL